MIYLACNLHKLWDKTWGLGKNMGNHAPYKILTREGNLKLECKSQFPVFLLFLLFSIDCLKRVTLDN